MARKRFKHEASQKRMLLASTLFALAASLPCAAKEAPVETLNLAAADWCPYSCASPSQPGFIAEALREILSLNGIELTVTVLPWSRAIKEAELGLYDGLLTAVESEAPDFFIDEHEHWILRNLCIWKSRTSIHIQPKRRPRRQNTWSNSGL